jgi:hypothetical protein
MSFREPMVVAIPHLRQYARRLALDHPYMLSGALTATVTSLVLTLL